MASKLSILIILFGYFQPNFAQQVNNTLITEKCMQGDTNFLSETTKRIEEIRKTMQEITTFNSSLYSKLIDELRGKIKTGIGFEQCSKVSEELLDMKTTLQNVTYSDCRSSYTIRAKYIFNRVLNSIKDVFGTITMTGQEFLITLQCNIGYVGDYLRQNGTHYELVERREKCVLVKKRERQCADVVGAVLRNEENYKGMLDNLKKCAGEEHIAILSKIVTIEIALKDKGCIKNK